MSIIYTPQGKAREYSPLALNHYSGCNHGCTYCYVPGMMRRFRGNYAHDIVDPRPNLILNLRREIHKFYNSEHPVLLSFTCDPYCHANDQYQLTRKVLEILLENKIPVSILTKGGSRCLQDIEIFKRFGENIQIGATLTFRKDMIDILEYEPYAADTENRKATLRELKKQGIKTWASFEPVLNPTNSLILMEEVSDFVDVYKVGKLNHHPDIEKNIDWGKFLTSVIGLLRDLKKKFYIKTDLAKFDNARNLKPEEKDMDFLNLGSWIDKSSEIKNER